MQSGMIERLRFRTRLCRTVLVLGAFGACCAPRQVAAQPVPSRDPSSTHIFPAGGRRGTVVPVLVGGECIPPETALRVFGDGVKAPDVLGSKVRAKLEPSPRREPREIPICYPKEWESKIEIASDAPVGVAMWRLTCARGGTGTRPFVIGDLPEFIETESNSLPERAERITIPVTVNGRIAGESDLDYFLFSSNAGQLITCDLVAGRLGSPLDPVLELQHADGRPVSYELHRIGTDPVLRFRVPETGDYRIMVSNISFHGGPAHVYRLTIAAGDTEPLASPPDLAASHDHTGGTRPLIAVEPQDTSSPIDLELPAEVVGRFETAMDEDVFRFHAHKDQAIAIECRPYPPGGASLPVVMILDAREATLARANSAESPDRVCSLEWRAPADGEYRLRLRDVQHGTRGGKEFMYSLAVRPALPDFSLHLPSDFTNVMQGGRTELQVQLRRSGGFNGVVELAFEGLPRGITVAETKIPQDQNSAKLLIQADPDARPTDTAIRLVGRAVVGGDPLERAATAPHLGHDPEGASIAAPTTDRIHLTVQHKPVFRLYCNEAYQYAHRGTVYPYLMELERLDGFDGPITIQLGDRQNRDLDGVEFIEVTVPPGKNEARVPIWFPETMHINVVSQSQIYAQAYAFFTDKWGQRQSTLVVSEKRNMVRTMPTVAKLDALEKRLVARPGSTVHCKLKLERTANFTGVMQVELIEPESGFLAEKIRFEPTQDVAEIEVRIPDSFPASQGISLRFRGRGLMSPEVTVVSDATVEVGVGSR